MSLPALLLLHAAGKYYLSLIYNITNNNERKLIPVLADLQFRQSTKIRLSTVQCVVGRSVGLLDCYNRLRSICRRECVQCGWPATFGRSLKYDNAVDCLPQRSPKYKPPRMKMMVRK